MIFTGDCVTVMRGMEAESVDAIVTDPPAGIAFMSKHWDRDKGGRTEWVAWMTEVMRECYRVLKPGGYAVVWSLPRTCHWTAWAMEDAGFIIRDQLAHIFASGFPKGKAQLKPAREDWWLARKPGPLQPLQIDATRIGSGDQISRDFDKQKSTTGDQTYGQFPNRPEGGKWEGAAMYVQDCSSCGQRHNMPPGWDLASNLGKGCCAECGSTDLEIRKLTGRWPSNVLLQDPELFDEPNPYVVGSGATATSGWRNEDRPDGALGIAESFGAADVTGPHYEDGGGYSRFFIIPKADRADREPIVRDAAVLLHRARGECDKLTAWESEGQSPDERTDSTSPARATSEVTTTPADSSTATSSPGNGSTDQSPRAIKSTTSTGTSRTTGSPTSSSSPPPITSESTPDASLSMGFGGSPALSASSSDLSSPSGGTSPRKDGPSTGAVGPATSGKSSRRNRCALCGKPLPRVGTHPTTKPTDLMRHLIRLVTPPGGRILDPFLGSGTTGIAAELEGFEWVGIEQSDEYVAIAEARLNGTQRGLGLDVPAPTKAPPKTHPDLSKHQPKRRAPHKEDAIFTRFVGQETTGEDAA